MTQDQLLMTVRMLMQAAGVVLVTHGLQTDAQWAAWTGLVIAAVPVFWSYYARRQAGLKTTVGNMPDTVVVTTAPQASVTQLADKIATLPESNKVITTTAVADATVSTKVTDNASITPKAAA